MLAFGEWLPDLADLDSGSITRDARNVLCRPNSYRPMKSPAPYTDNALGGAVDNLLTEDGDPILTEDGDPIPGDPEVAVGITLARDTSAAWRIFAGTNTALYKFESDDWTDYTRATGIAYTLADGDLWSFAQFGDTLIACHPGDEVQAVSVTGGTQFAALAGSPPQARGVSVVGDFVVLWQLAEAKNKIAWSGINNTTSWTPGTDLSDEQEFPDGGIVTGVSGGIEIAYVLQEQCIRTMRFVPGSATNAFEFAKPIDSVGCVSPYGWAQRGATVYFKSESGFHSIGPDGLRAIGDQKVDEWFASHADLSYTGQIQAFADPYKPLILWAYRTPTAVSTFDRVLIYDISLDRFTYAVISASVWGTAATPGISLDAITTDLDSLEYSLDSRIFEGGRPVVVAIDENGLLSFLEGPNLEAVLETCQSHLIPGKRFMCQGAYPITDAENATIRVATRERLSGTSTYTDFTALDRTGTARGRVAGRVARFEITIPAGEVWTHAQGVQPMDLTEDGDQ